MFVSPGPEKWPGRHAPSPMSPPNFKVSFTKEKLANTCCRNIFFPGFSKGVRRDGAGVAQASVLVIPLLSHQRGEGAWVRA